MCSCGHSGNDLKDKKVGQFSYRSSSLVKVAGAIENNYQHFKKCNRHSKSGFTQLYVGAADTLKLTPILQGRTRILTNLTGLYYLAGSGLGQPAQRTIFPLNEKRIIIVGERKSQRYKGGTTMGYGAHKGGCGMEEMSSSPRQDKRIWRATRTRICVLAVVFLYSLLPVCLGINAKIPLISDVRLATSSHRNEPGKS